MSVVMTPLLTPQDVLDMVNRGELTTDQPWELVDGEIVWLAASQSYASRVCVRISHVLTPFTESIEGAIFDSSAGFTVGERLQQLRSPDVSIVVKERLHLMNDYGWVAGAPDLAVEVLSEDQYGEGYARVKVPEYLSAGSRVVWLVHPKRKTVREYIAGRSEFTTYSGDAEITLDVIAPGFRAKISSFFP
ncbi:MAG TPA: Uma2 family endonuclease [Chloroflexota bacterium]|nr:Uma2 family endonuclease [Chloroflexota bacterium]